MASTSIPYTRSLLLLFSCIWTQLSADSTGAAKQQNDCLIQKVCSNAESPEFCFKTLRPYPRSATADLPGIAKVTVGLALFPASTTKSLIATLFKQVSDPANRTTLTDWSNYFDRAILQLNAAKKYLVAKDYNSANVGAAIAERAMDLCSTTSLSDNSPSPKLETWTVIERDYCNILCETSGLLLGEEYL
ncbi:hypothetical protein RHMOL_Rhmol01G0024900 [Rhododendron molle]|uniref:Uncharacterized protein n=1 Tax=Rhododendron molle TaxID=49168 RepID=A0ACC0PYT9_RHOML|nr:hypothetical protein RHMOL_Rhmol01G0024900 [Rhododendron molle]